MLLLQIMFRYNHIRCILNTQDFICCVHTTHSKNTDAAHLKYAKLGLRTKKEESDWKRGLLSKSKPKYDPNKQILGSEIRS